VVFLGLAFDLPLQLPPVALKADRYGIEDLWRNFGVQRDIFGRLVGSVAPSRPPTIAFSMVANFLEKWFKERQSGGFNGRVA
jgi:hypothetical protein